MSGSFDFEAFMDRNGLGKLARLEPQLPDPADVVRAAREFISFLQDGNRDSGDEQIDRPEEPYDDIDFERGPKK